MKQFFQMGWDSFGFYFESRLMDLYLSNQLIALGLALAIALRIRKVLKTRKAGK